MAERNASRGVYDGRNRTEYDGRAKKFHRDEYKYLQPAKQLFVTMTSFTHVNMTFRVSTSVIAIVSQ